MNGHCTGRRVRVSDITGLWASRISDATGGGSRNSNSSF
jgi:hypothetical protein